MKEELNQALALHKKGLINEAEKIYLNLIKTDKNNPSLMQLLGTLYLQKKNYTLSEEYFLKGLNLEPENASILNNLGILNKQKNKIEKSLDYFTLNIKKNNFLNSWINKSNILLENKNYIEGLDFTKKALLKYPNNTKLNNNFALFLFENGFKDDALKLYRDLDNKNIHSIESYLNYANILKQIKNFSDAIDILNKVLLININNLNALRLRADIYKRLLEFDKAEHDLLKIISIENLNIPASKDLVELYIDTKNYKKALSHCDLMISKDIEIDFFLLKKIISNINSANWIDIKNELEIVNKKFDLEKTTLDPLSLKYFNDNPLLQKKLTENFWKNKTKYRYLSNIQFEEKIQKDNSKIRIGYFSADFNNHAVFQLIQDLFVNHNKSKFEIYAYSFLNKKGSSRDKIISNVNKFIDVENFMDEELIKLVKSDCLDIAIDLSGYTKNNRSYLFEHDIAKIKINYLGYPGTMGTEKYDYIIADKLIIPKEHFDYYSEKVIYMPEIYQPFSPEKFDMKIERSEFHLPKDAFILGCFSRIEKILPNVFDIWMKILNKHKDIYLALCIKDEFVKSNIKIYCDTNNFDYERIIFLEPIEHKNNLRRISTFDLYLDTFPYNGHTGISDSLFQSCVPTISFTGNSFASRVSYSLLCSLKLSQLISYNKKDYFDKIDYFCTERSEIKKIKDYLIEFKENNFNRMIKFTNDFEELIVSALMEYEKKI